MTLIAADDRAVLSAEETQRYQLGPEEAPLVTFGAVDSYGVMWLCPEPVGWDSATVTTPMDRRQHGHGGYAGETTMAERVLSFEGSAAAPTIRDARLARERLRTALLGNLSGWTLYTHLDDEPAKSLWVKPDGQPRIAITDGRWLDYTFVLVAEDPVKFGAEHTYGPAKLALGGSEEGGVESPWTAPLAVTGGSTVPLVAIPNAGDEWAHAVYTITGPIPSPSVELSNGELIGLDLTLGANDTAVLDTRTGTAVINGALRLDALTAGSTFPLIPPGGTEVRLRSLGGGTDQAAELYVTTAPAWK